MCVLLEVNQQHAKTNKTENMKEVDKEKKKKERNIIKLPVQVRSAVRFGVRGPLGH